MDQQINERVDAGFAQVGTEFSKVHAKIDLVHAERVERSNTMLLKWMFGSQISVAAIFIAAVKYL